MTESVRPNHRGTTFFLITLVALFGARLFIDMVRLPASTADALQVVTTLVFVAIPLFALYRASADEWPVSKAATFFGVGVGLHILGKVIAHFAFKDLGFGSVLFEAIAQTGLMIWCAGLGALIASLLKDKNLILPVAIFLACFDMFLVFNPAGPTAVMLKYAPQIFKAVAIKVPSGVGIQPLVEIGPADFMFLMMFFVAVHKFGMRSRQTAIWMIPTLIAYLFVVLFLGKMSMGPISLGALPALLPMGLVVLLVNLPEFQMNKEEKLGTFLATVLGLSLVAIALWRASHNKPTVLQAAPSSVEAVPLKQAQEGSLPQGAAGQSP